MAEPVRLDSLPAPAISFASDNAAGVHPLVMDALVAANEGSALAYGSDAWTARTEARFRDLFGADVAVALCWGGTGANVVALQSLLRPWQSVICSDSAHIAVDECGAPERFTGAKLVDLPTEAAKLSPEQIREQLHVLGDEHHAQPAVVSITQSSESGTLYSVDEIAAIVDVAHAAGMRVHMDGARIANATAALGGDVDALRSMTRDAGVDVISFGGTKAGMMYGEAVVFLDPALGRDVKFVRKQAGQLPSKMRYVAAQFEALLHDDLWIRLAAHANGMAQTLYGAVSGIDGVTVGRSPEVNSVFARLDRTAIDALQAWSFFWDWDVAVDEVRWMTSWATSDDDVSAFAAGVAAAAAGVG
ncbi:MAG: aminotransferase class V-fold PLP-dependent enzyme [Acidimicrobiales bacterium]